MAAHTKGVGVSTWAFKSALTILLFPGRDLTAKLVFMQLTRVCVLFAPGIQNSYESNFRKVLRGHEMHACVEKGMLESIAGWRGIQASGAISNP